jgi:hypothetical protein
MSATPAEDFFSKPRRDRSAWNDEADAAKLLAVVATDRNASAIARASSSPTPEDILAALV